MDKSTVLSKLRKIKPELEEKYGLKELALFGSYSRDEQKPDSDIDLIVDFKEVNVDNFFNCIFELEDTFPEKKVQVVTRGGIKPKYFEAIKPDLIYA